MTRSHTLFGSVRGRLVLLVLALLIPSLLLVAVLIWRAHHSERKSVGRQMLATAQAIGAVIDREIGEADALLRALASSQALRAGDLAGVHEMAQRALADDARWFTLVDAQDRQIVNTLVSFGTELPFMPGDEEMRAAMEAGRAHMSNVVRGPVSQALVVHVSRPVLVGGQLQYTLHLTTRVAHFADTLGLDRYSPSSLISIVDRKGRIAARTRNPDRYVGEQASSTMRAQYESAGEGVRDTVTLDGVESLTAFHRAPVSGWTVIIAAPKSGILASARELLWIGLALSGFLLLFAGGFAIWIVRGLTRGLDSLVAGSEAITRGEPVDFRPSGLRETDLVAAAIARSASHQLQISEQLKKALGEEQAARSKAQQAAERLSFSLAALDLGEWEWNEADDTMRISARTATMFSLDRHLTYTREEMNQRLDPDDVAPERAVFKAAVAAGVPYHHEFRIKHPVLGERWIAAWGRPVLDGSGKLVGMMGVVQDTTERKQAELMLRTQNELLEQRVVERTRRLQEISTFRGSSR